MAPGSRSQLARSAWLALALVLTGAGCGRSEVYTEDDAGAPACPPAPCVVDPVAQTNGCAGRAGVTAVVFDGHRGLVTLDMKQLGSIRVEADVCEPIGFTFSIGDSPTDDGFCGDSGSRDHDAELWVTDSTVGVCEDDLAVTSGGMKKTWSFDGPATSGCTTLAFDVRDSELDYENQGQVLKSPFLFRFGQPDVEGGGPDWDLFIGLNQVPLGDRTGTGLKRVRLFLDGCR